MNIFFEESNFFYGFSYKDKKLSNPKTINLDLENLLISDLPEKSKNNTFLLNENRFVFQNFLIQESTNEKLTMSYLNQILEKKKTKIYETNWNIGYFLFYNINDIIVNQERKNYVIGESGNIMFNLNIAYLDIETSTIFKSFYGNKFIEDVFLNIYPSSFFTLWFLKNSFDKRNFAMLYIFEDFAKLIIIKNWFYEYIFNIKLWISTLKTIFQENNIFDLYQKSFSTKDFNSFQTNLINECMDFYSNFLIKWLKDCDILYQDLILFSDIINNKFFLENFGKKYTYEIMWYAIPFHYSEKINSKGNKNLKKIFTDVISYLNTID